MSKSTSSDVKFMISPLSKIPIKCDRNIRNNQSLLNIQNKHLTSKTKKRISNFKSLKFDKNDGNPSGCCVSCV